MRPFGHIAVQCIRKTELFKQVPHCCKFYFVYMWVIPTMKSKVYDLGLFFCLGYEIKVGFRILFLLLLNLHKIINTFK